MEAVLFQLGGVLSMALLVFWNMFSPTGAMLEPNSAGEWVPNITAVQDDVGKSLLIQVRPADKAIDHLKVCVSKQSSVHCMGTVFLLESPEDSYKYRVEDLVANISYTVFIKAFNADGDEITVWFRKKNPVFLQPWPQEPTTAATATIWPLAVQPATPVRHTVQPVKESVGVGLGVMVGLGMLLLLVPLLVVLSACALWHRGYLRNIPFFRVCFPHSATAGPTVKVLQLYVRESEPFQQVVKEHVQYLGHFVHLDVQDCGKMRQQADPALWLARVAADRRVLVYLSPQLTRGLLQVKETSHHSWPNDPYCTTSAVTACANLIHSLAVANQPSSTGRPKGKKPILVLSGGFPSDEEDEAHLRQHGSFKALPTFWICKDSLASPAPLVACLSSWHRRSRAPLEDQMLERSQELSQAIASLRCTTSRPQYTPGGDLILNGGGDYMYFRNLNDGRNGYLPHRTDSGFSSSATDHQHGGGSNSSSEHHASPGEACAELGAEEAYTEMEPMIQRPLKDQPLTSVSQLRLFMPPESDAGDLDSMVLAEEFRKVNARGDWSD